MNFRSAEQAVRFATNISERVEYAKSNPEGVRGTSAEELTPMDLHAQAAMILSVVGRMPEVERDSLMAMYGRGSERGRAMLDLARRLFPGVRNTVPCEHDVSLVVAHWATRRPSIREIATDRGVSFRQVCNWRRAVLREWLPVQVRAQTRLHEELVARGVTLESA